MYSLSESVLNERVTPGDAPQDSPGGPPQDKGIAPQATTQVTQWSSFKQSQYQSGVKKREESL